MNASEKLGCAFAVPMVVVLADWVANENEAGYNTGLARGLFFLFLAIATGLVLNGQRERYNADRKLEAERAEKIRAMLQKSIDRNLGKGN